MNLARAAVLLLLLTACGSTPWMPGKYSDPVVEQEYARTVMIGVACQDGSVRMGSGVRVGGHGVVTAHHVLDCGTQGRVILVQPGADPDQVYAARVSVDSEEEDVTRLEVPELAVMPRVEVEGLRIGERACGTFALPEVGRRCGEVWAPYATLDGSIHIDYPAEHGNSGGPLWAPDGALAGIVVELAECRGTDNNGQICGATATPVDQRPVLTGI